MYKIDPKSAKNILNIEGFNPFPVVRQNKLFHFGGIGSGDFGHKGRPGLVGGSSREMDPERTLYHGTPSLKAANNIRKNGLDINKGVAYGDKPLIWSTTSYEIAQGYGRGDKNKGTYAIVVLKPEARNLTKDKDFSTVITFEESIPPEYIERIDVYSFRSQKDEFEKDKLVKQFSRNVYFYVPIEIEDDGEYNFSGPSGEQ